MTAIVGARTGAAVADSAASFTPPAASAQAPSVAAAESDRGLLLYVFANTATVEPPAGAQELADTATVSSGSNVTLEAAMIAPQGAQIVTGPATATKHGWTIGAVLVLAAAS